MKFEMAMEEGLEFGICKRRVTERVRGIRRGVKRGERHVDVDWCRIKCMNENDSTTLWVEVNQRARAHIHTRIHHERVHVA